MWGCIAMTVLLLIIGCLGIARDNKQVLSAVVALMAIWGFLVRDYIRDLLYICNAY